VFRKYLPLSLASSRKYDKQLRALEKASSVAFGGVGVAATILPETQAYDELAGARDPALKPRLERLVAKATPAGKVYAALLLDRIDPAAGRRAWQRLARDTTPVSTFSGCLMGSSTLAEYAATQLA
jgi:hypothetical protein